MVTTHLVDIQSVLGQSGNNEEWLCAYSIADIATYPWVFRHEWQMVDLAEFPQVKRWYDAMSARPAVQRGMKIPS